MKRLLMSYGQVDELISSTSESLGANVISNGQTKNWESLIHEQMKVFFLDIHASERRTCASITS